LKVIAGKTFKALADGQEIWTAPVLIRMPKRENRWATENLLRKSKVFPSFNWPKEMVDSVKIFRKEVKEMGYAVNTHYSILACDWRRGRDRVEMKIFVFKLLRTKFFCFSQKKLTKSCESFCKNFPSAGGKFFCKNYNFPCNLSRKL
jgi:hypothetical protein